MDRGLYLEFAPKKKAHKSVPVWKILVLIYLPTYLGLVFGTFFLHAAWKYVEIIPLSVVISRFDGIIFGWLYVRFEIRRTGFNTGSSTDFEPCNSR